MSEPIATPESEVEPNLLEKTPELEPGSMTTTGKVLLWSSVGAFVFAGILIGAAVYRRRGGT